MNKSYLITNRITEIDGAWTDVAPEIKLAGMTEAEFKTAVAPCTSTRETLESMSTTIRATIADRNAADLAARKLIKRVVAAVVADPTLGPDSPLYRAMRYVPDAERSNGTVRKAAVTGGVKPTAPTPPASA